jgi:predicted MFS family arabinose efflux permease
MAVVAKDPVLRPRLILGLLFLVEVMNYFDRQIVNILAQQIKLDLRISDAELGLLTGTAFGVVYSVLAIPLGRIGDRYDRGKLIAIVVAMWSGFTIACGFAANFVQLALARAGVAIGEAGCQPASTSLIADLFAGPRRASSISIFFLGVPVGSFLGLLAGGLMAVELGWRAAFIVAGLPGLVLVVVLMIFVVDPKQSAQAREKEAPPAASPGTVLAVLFLLRRPGYLWLLLAMICSTFQIYVGGAWLPTFFIRYHEMTTAEIGVFAALAVGLGGALGTMGGGMFCDSLRGRAKDVEILTIILVMLLSIPTLVATVMLKDLKLALCAMFLFNVFSFAYLSPGIVLMQKAATESTRALSVALTSSVAAITGLCLGVPLVGAVSDLLTPGFGVRALGFAMLICALAGVIGAFACWHFRKALRVSDGGGDTSFDGVATP